MKALRNWSTGVVFITALGMLSAGCSEGDTKNFGLPGASSVASSLILNQPTANPTPVVAGSGDEVTLTITVDASNPVTVNWTQRGGQSVSLTTSSNGNVFIARFNEPGVSGDLTFQALVTGQNATSQTSNDVVVEVTGSAPANQPPVFRVQPFASPTSGVAGSSTVVTLECTVDDVDGDSLQLTWTQTFGVQVSLSTSVLANGVFKATFTIPSTAGNLTFEVSADDKQGHQVGSLPVTVQVTSATGGNNPPVFTSTLTALPTAVQQATSGTVTLETRAIDPDGDNLTVAWRQTAGSPQSLSVTHVADSIIATLTNPLLAGDYKWVVDVSDGIAPAVSSNEVTLVVTATPPPGDREPVITQQLVATPPIMVAGSATQGTLQFSGNDPDGDPVTVTVRQTAGIGVNMAITTLGDQTTVTFTAPASADTLTFEADLSSTTFVTTTTPVSVTVTPSTGNNAPVISVDISASPPAVQGSSGNTVIMQFTGTDPNGDALTVNWVQISGPTVTQSRWQSGDTYYNSWPAPVTTGNVVFEGSLSDTALVTSTSQVSIPVTVNPPGNQPPTITVQPVASPASLQAGFGAQGSVSFTTTDPESDPLTVSWSQISGPTVNLSASSLGDVYTVTFPASASSGTVVLQASVTDSINTPVATNQVSITITPAAPGNQPPTIVSQPVANPTSLPEGSAAQSAVSFNVTDPEADPLTVTWTQVSGPTVTWTTSIVGSTYTAIVTAPATSGTVVLQASASDGNNPPVTTNQVSIVITTPGGGGGGGTPTLASIAIATTASTVDVGVVSPATAVRTHDDGSTDTITTTMLWEFLPPSTGVADRNGRVTLARPNKTGKLTAYDTGGTPSGLNVTRTYLELIGSNELSITSTTVAPVSSQLALLTDTGTAFVGATGRLYIDVVELSTDTDVTTTVSAGGTVVISSGQTKAVVAIDISGRPYITGQNAGVWTLTVTWNGMSVTLDGRTIITNPLMMSDPFHTLKGVVDPIVGMTRPYFENGVWNYSLLFNLDPSIVASMANPGFWGYNTPAPVAMATTFLDENGVAWAAYPDTYTGGSGPREPPGFLYLGDFDAGPSTGWTWPSETSVQGSLLYDGIIGNYKFRFRMHKSTNRNDIWSQPVYYVSTAMRSTDLNEIWGIPDCRVSQATRCTDLKGIRDWYKYRASNS